MPTETVPALFAIERASGRTALGLRMIDDEEHGSPAQFYTGRRRLDRVPISERS
jgi:citrate synthase